MKEYVQHDELVLMQQAKSIGCQVPYHNTLKQLRTCRREEEMRQSMYDLNIVKDKYYPVVCETISKIDVDLDIKNHSKSWEQKLFGFWFTYPYEVKIITQSKSIDGQALIGNIGGYIGLFLGTFNKSIAFIK